MAELSRLPAQFVGSEIHGFRGVDDLDICSIMEEAKTRWLRPNEILAILCNHKMFTINVKPVTLPKSGTILMFDRKMFRNFRKDGYNWKKKKDGKTVKEAHEHLKVGNEERIHVYYAHGEDNPTFVRRCYWLLDKSLENIVLVHYRETQELQGSPTTPVNSSTNSGISDPASSWSLSDEIDSVPYDCYGAITPNLECSAGMTSKDHEQRLHEINTLEWDELLGSDDPQSFSLPQEGQGVGGLLLNSLSVTTELMPGEASNVNKASLTAQGSFGSWMSNLIDDVQREPLTLSAPFNDSMVKNQDASMLGQIIKIMDISPGWAFSYEETKILVVGAVEEGHESITGLELYLVCGNYITPVEVLQAGVYRCRFFPQTTGLVNLFLSIDGNQPISQIWTFEIRAPLLSNTPTSSENKADWVEFQLQMRLARLLFSSSKSMSVYSSGISQSALKEAKAFLKKTSDISESWMSMEKMIEDAQLSFPHAKNRLFELILQNRLQEFLLEKVVSGYKVFEHAECGLGVIHFCAILGYIWSVHLFSCSGLSLDYRDKFGWTALHWAAYHGKEKMVAALLSAGAKPNLVTHPTSKNRAGSNAADLASENGYDGLAAYLSEQALVTQFNEMTIAGNMSGSLEVEARVGDTIGNLVNLTEEQLNLKESLSAYRTAADAASRIQVAFRERSLRLRTKAVESSSPDMEARNIVAAMKIQHAYRSYETRKQMVAAARIQYRFRTWKMRKQFLSMRCKAIKIQAMFRGYQVRKQYRKFLWSVGVIDKAILRWRMKRKGFRGLQLVVGNGETGDVEEEFFKDSRRQAEERVERSVVRVQALFRSKRAQEEYRRMKVEHNKAAMEYNERHLSRPSEGRTESSV